MVFSGSIVLSEVIFLVASVALCASFVRLVVRVVPLMVAPVVHSLRGRIHEACLVLICSIVSGIECSVLVVKVRSRVRTWVPCDCDFL